MDWPAGNTAAAIATLLRPPLRLRLLPAPLCAIACLMLRCRYATPLCLFFIVATSHALRRVISLPLFAMP